MAVICPTVLAAEPHAYREQMERIAPFAERIQIDLSDGIFAPGKTVDLANVWWPHSIKADLHLMYQQPAESVGAAIKLEPHLVIVHAEADGNFADIAEKLHAAGVKVGIALLPATGVDTIAPIAEIVDHVLIFAGKLGSFGGQPNIDDYKDKIDKLKHHYPHVEIGWDGGVSSQNVKQLTDLGVNVLNVGGFIQKAEDPEKAYATLKEIT